MIFLLAYSWNEIAYSCKILLQTTRLDSIILIHKIILLFTSLFWIAQWWQFALVSTRCNISTKTFHNFTTSAHYNLWTATLAFELMTYLRFDRDSCWRCCEKKVRLSERQYSQYSWRRIWQRSLPKRWLEICWANSLVLWMRPDGRTIVPTSPIKLSSCWSFWIAVSPRDSVQTDLTTRR